MAMRFAQIDFIRAARWLFFISAVMLLAAIALAVVIPTLLPR